MTRKYYPSLAAEVFTCRTSCGLTVKVVPQPGFTRKMAYFVTDFGSVHTDFQLDGQEYHVPAGIAHFLEHKMFELPGRDVTAEFAARGANVNAFTSYDMTAYYFSCVENFWENLKLLLEFVSTPYFPEESVQREMGIIDQEIGMHEDTPDTRVFEDLMKIVYNNHPVRVPILGSRESLRQITPSLLESCHRAFYTPSNMILCVVGDVEPEKVAELAETVLGTEERPAGKKLRPWQEKMQVEAPQCTGKMEVAMPMFQMAFKSEPVGTGMEAMKAEVIGDLAAEALFGESSPLYLELYEKGLIDASFGGGFETVDGCAMLTCGGDSEDGQAVCSAILSRGAELAQEGISEADFLRMKRSAMGRRIRDLDSFDSTCFRICAYHFSDFEYFDFPAAYAEVTQEQVQEYLKQVVTKERCALSVIEPKEEKEK
ncbi:MAG: insulinase family protein [Ruminococcaceae bacterium]|nr:insulinase family protein [Oscillospiraceae bacterium]